MNNLETPTQELVIPVGKKLIDKPVQGMGAPYVLPVSKFNNNYVAAPVPFAAIYITELGKKPTSFFTDLVTIATNRLVHISHICLTSNGPGSGYLGLGTAPIGSANQSTPFWAANITFPYYLNLSLDLWLSGRTLRLATGVQNVDYFIYMYGTEIELTNL